MIKISKRSAVCRLTLFAVLALIVATGCAIYKNKRTNVNALTPDGETVTIGDRGTQQYGDSDYDYTHLYTVDGKEAFCAEANRAYTHGSTIAEPYEEAGKADKIKLAIFLYDTYNSGNAFHSVPAAEEARNNVYGHWEGNYYSWTHFTVHQIYTGSKAPDLSDEVGQKVATDIAKIENYISTNDPVWLMAKNYKLYYAGPPSDGMQNMMWIERYPMGDLTVNKKDAETNSCNVKTSGLSFSGTTFKVINKTGYPFARGENNEIIDIDGEVAEITMREGECSFSVENLPYGNYQIKETQAGTGYTAASPITVTVPSNNSVSINAEVENQPIRGNLRFTKKNSENGRPMANTLFSIKSLATGETHYIVTNTQGVADTSTIQHSSNTNGYDAKVARGEDVKYSNNIGIWFGLDSEGHQLQVNNNLGALPYGEYLIQEVSCDANKFCEQIESQKKTIRINTQQTQPFDLGDWDNDCSEFNLGTSAFDKKDGDRYVEADDEVTIVDRVEYCVQAGKTYTLKGILMDKSTGEPLLIDGSKVESSLEITPTTNCGFAEMEFKFDGTGYGGQKIVVFEDLYYEDELIVSHNEINDVSQTIETVYIHTYTSESSTGKKTLPINADVEIKDTVDYCLTPGVTYTIKGVLMDKDKNAPFLVDGKQVESEVTIHPEEKCGQTVMYFNINTSGLGGKHLVVFESLYLVAEPDQLIVKHEDINNYDETIEVEPEVPETGIATNPDESGKSSNDIFVTMSGAVVLVSLGGYIFARHSSKRRVIKF